MLTVMKFGGSSVADNVRIRNVAFRLSEAWRRGDDVVAVLSAMGDTTDELLEKAYLVNPSPSKRELDMLLATGEQVSVALMAMALGAMGIPAVSLNAAQVPMKTNASHGNAKLRSIDTERIRAELESRKVVIVTGFQGVSRNEDITTLGRGGSDTTAVALAAVLGADLCEIYTDVEGVYTADPRIVPNARKLAEISYDEMLEYASVGAKVLHNRSVEMAKRYRVPLVVRSSMCDAPGTLVRDVRKNIDGKNMPGMAGTAGAMKGIGAGTGTAGDGTAATGTAATGTAATGTAATGTAATGRGGTMERMLISGVAADTSVARVTVVGAENRPGVAFGIFQLLAKNNINVDIIIQAAGNGDNSVSFTVDRRDLKETVDLLGANLTAITGKGVEFDEHVAKVSVIGAGMTGNPGVAARMFEALYAAHVNIKLIATSEIRITVLIDESEANRAVRAIHDAFGLDA
ncbi:MAG: aspartate kinase [Lachnospiraceae bacterium]|nr:aspartate kinase [Lachnospiraceae bacterium]